MPSAMRAPNAPFLITFSGMDGAGKTTQIENLRAELLSRGYPSLLLTFWDNVVVLSRFREEATHRVLKSEKGIGTRGRPVARRDKNVRAWYLTLLRCVLYFLDAVHLRIVIRRATRSRVSLVILDRYIFDEIANLPLRNSAGRAYARLLARIAPHPNIAYVLDADPFQARERKPEYPLAFLRECRQTYLHLASLLDLAVVTPDSVDEMTRAVLSRALIEIASKQPPNGAEAEQPVTFREAS